MATPIRKTRSTPAPAISPTMHDDRGGFDIVATIGSVRFGDGPETAVVAAMKVIGEHNREGVYRFPHEDGGEWVVEMNHTNARADSDTQVDPWNE